MCVVRYLLARPQGCEQLPTSFREPRRDHHYWNAHQRCSGHQHPKRITLGEEYPSQVSVPCRHGTASVNIFTVFSSVIIDSLGGSASFLPVRKRHREVILDANCYLSGVFTILGDSYNSETRTWDLSGRHILRQQDFWFAMGMTTL